MPPKAADASKAADKGFSTDHIVALLAAMAVDGSSTPGAKHYQMMTKIDDTKTASAWEHTFRPIKKRAKDLADQIRNGDYGDFAAATPVKGSEAGGEKKTPAKRARKSKAEEGSPAKKVKKEVADADADGEEPSD